MTIIDQRDLKELYKHHIMFDYLVDMMYFLKINWIEKVGKAMKKSSIQFKLLTMTIMNEMLLYGI